MYGDMPLWCVQAVSKQFIIESNGGEWRGIVETTCG
jgi:hypothetical protein